MSVAGSLGSLAFSLVSSRTAAGYGNSFFAAAILLEPEQSLEPVDIIRHCEGQIAYFAIPRYVRIVSRMPLTENGKIKKVVLREAGVTPDMWDRDAAGYRLRR